MIAKQGNIVMLNLSPLQHPAHHAPNCDFSSSAVRVPLVPVGPHTQQTEVRLKGYISGRDL
jgi:hypothetical protein